MGRISWRRKRATGDNEEGGWGEWPACDGDQVIGSYNRVKGIGHSVE